jgi:hypothetical protein
MRWEYLVETMTKERNITYNKDTDNVRRKINEIGLDGWELISVVPDNNSNLQVLYFKRKKGWF